MLCANRRHLLSIFQDVYAVVFQSRNLLQLNATYRGDCLTLMKGIPDASVGMIFADLPYGVTNAHWDIMIPFFQMWHHFRRIIQPHRAMLFTATQPFASRLIMSNLKEYRHEWIWRKNIASNFQQATRQPLRITESVLVFASESPMYNPQGSQACMIKQSGGAHRLIDDAALGDPYIQTQQYYPKNILTINCTRGFHPTQKPVKLLEYLIKTYTNEGDTVLDPCAGSGTTAIACINTRRNYIVMEKDETIYSKMIERIHNHSISHATNN